MPLPVYPANDGKTISATTFQIDGKKSTAGVYGLTVGRKGKKQLTLTSPVKP